MYPWAVNFREMGFDGLIKMGIFMFLLIVGFFYVMKKKGITFEDNYSYRQLLQKQGPELMSQIQDEQGTKKCNSCDNPLVNASDIY